MSEDRWACPYAALYGQCHGQIEGPDGSTSRCRRPEVRWRLCWRHYGEEIRRERAEVVAVMRRLGCWYRNTRPPRQREGDVPRLPLVVLPPKGFHFEGAGHEVVLSTWWDVSHLLVGTRIVSCDDSCRIVN